METENNAIWKHANLLAKLLQSEDLDGVVTVILYDLEIPPNYFGFSYLKCAIPMALRRPSQLIAKELYAEVGASYEPEVDCVAMEGAIRKAIEKGWSTRRDDIWARYFPQFLLQRKKRPSNLEFISSVVYFLEMWQGCCREGEHAKQ